MTRRTKINAMFADLRAMLQMECTASSLTNPAFVELLNYAIDDLNDAEDAWSDAVETLKPVTP